jgi:hypothetical protein
MAGSMCIQAKEKKKKDFFAFFYCVEFPPSAILLTKEPFDRIGITQAARLLPILRPPKKPLYLMMIT